MDLPRILFITRKWAPAMGGMETYCVKLVKQLRRDHPVDLIALRGRADGRTPSVLSLVLFPFTVLRQWLGLKSAPDIVHLGDLAIWPFAMLHWLLAPGARIVISAHGTDISYSRRPSVLGKLYAAYQRIGARLFPRAKVIANSAATAGACRDIGWRDVVVCPLATDMDRQADIEPRRDTILFAGRLIRQKGLSWFVREVLPLLPERITLEVAGLPVDRVETAALDHPRVRFLGALPQSQLARRYAEALCVVVPNIDLGDGSFEGFGLVACEAAAAGGVVLASDLGGLSAAVRDGETGYLLTPSEAREWAAKIESVSSWSDSDRDSFTGKASSAARGFFSWERVCDQTQSEYGALLAGRRLA